MLRGLFMQTVVSARSTGIHHETMAKVVLRCWQDPDFRARLIADSKQVLQDEGLPVSADLECIILPDAPQAHHFDATPPAVESLSKEELLEFARVEAHLIMPILVG
jgi:hypothetical protein